MEPSVALVTLHGATDMNPTPVKKQAPTSAGPNKAPVEPGAAAKPNPASAPSGPASKDAPAPNQKLPQNPNAADLKEAPPQGKGAPPPKGGPSGPPNPDAGPLPLPQGTSPELSEAYNFLQKYISDPANRGTLNLGQMPDVGTDSPLNQIGNILPKTIAGSIKNYPNFSNATGSTPSPQLQTGVMPTNLVGGLSKLEVAMNQIPLPISGKA